YIYISADEETEFDYIEGSPRGPENWWRLEPNGLWETCGTGQRQSPIDLNRPHLPGVVSPLVLTHRPAHAILRNRGHDIAVQWTNQDAGGFYVEGTLYTLVQCHWHSLSEHHINGNGYDLELHLVHVSEEGKVAVIGILYQIGHRPDYFLSKIMDGIKRLVKNVEEKWVDVGVVNPRDVKIGHGEYYRYNGSLTTPACDEGVIWTVMKERYPFNARPIQGTYGRPIWLYRQHDHHLQMIQDAAALPLPTSI
ncbi:Alpha carbonic anhydrase 4, partial [Nymphaea thermarum]